MESGSERPEITAFLELEHGVRSAGEILAAYRRRALTAEGRLKELEGADGEAPVTGKDRAQLEEEIAQLRARLEHATSRTQQMLDRVRFLRQQQTRGE